MMAACCFIGCLCIYVGQHNLVPLLQDFGYTATEASGIYATMMLVLKGIKFGTGVLCDAITAKRVTMCCVPACGVGMMLLMLLPKSGIYPYVAAFVFALSLPLLTILITLLGSELFGHRSQSYFVGVFMAMVAAANMVESLLSNSIYDLVGSYEPVYWAGAVVMFALCGVYLVLFRMMNRTKKKLLAASALQ